MNGKGQKINIIQCLRTNVSGCEWPCVAFAQEIVLLKVKAEGAWVLRLLPKCYPMMPPGRKAPHSLQSTITLCSHRN